MSVPKRSERDSSLYEKINSQNYDEFNKDLSFLINKKDRDYYEAVSQNIRNNLIQRSLYATPALSDEQKYVRMHEQIKNWLNQLKDMINQVDSETDNSLAKSEWYKQQETNINDLFAKVFSTRTDYEIKEKMADVFASHYKRHQVTDAEVWTGKQVDYDDNNKFKEFLKRQLDANKTRLANSKRSLEGYKIKWIWYVIPFAVLLIGAILCIVLPAVL